MFLNSAYEKPIPEIPKRHRFVLFTSMKRPFCLIEESGMGRNLYSPNREYPSDFPDSDISENRQQLIIYKDTCNIHSAATGEQTSESILAP